MKSMGEELGTPRKSRYRGVAWDKYRYGGRGCWVAYIVVAGRQRHVGSFGQDEEAAARARDSAYLAAGGNPMRLNFPTERG